MDMSPNSYSMKHSFNRERQRSIQLYGGLSARASMTKLNMRWYCLRDPCFRFDFRVELLLVLLTVVATEQRQRYYLPIVAVFEFHVFPSSKQPACQNYTTQSVLLFGIGTCRTDSTIGAAISYSTLLPSWSKLILPVSFVQWKTLSS